MSPSVYYKAPSTYKFFLMSKGTVLPAPTTIANWLKKFSYNPSLFKALKTKVQTMVFKMKEGVMLID